jgi:uncharacterized membrane protein YhdT
MSTDRHTETYQEDPRHRQCRREALAGLGLGILNLIWWFGWGYGLGSGPVSEYTYMYGFPLWFFMSCIVGAALFTLLAVVMAKVFFADAPLGKLEETPEGEEARPCQV